MPQCGSNPFNSNERIGMITAIIGEIDGKSSLNPPKLVLVNVELFR
jgi:hypothetical protein